jgi:hypothetical protein
MKSRKLKKPAFSFKRHLCFIGASPKPRGFKASAARNTLGFNPFLSPLSDFYPKTRTIPTLKTK